MKNKLMKFQNMERFQKNLEISDATAKIGTNVNGHTNNGYANNYSSSTEGDLEKQEPNIKDQEFEMDNSLVPNEHEEVKKSIPTTSSCGCGLCSLEPWRQ